jgi:hypothetical protein
MMTREDVENYLKENSFQEEEREMFFALLEQIQQKYSDEDKYSDEAFKETCERFPQYLAVHTGPIARVPKDDNIGQKFFMRLGLVLFLSCLGYMSWYFFRTDLDRPQIVKDYRKGLYIPDRSKGDLFTYQVIVRRGGEDSREEVYQEQHRVRKASRSEIEWLVTRVDTQMQAKVWTYRNPFMIPLKTENYWEGDNQLTRYSGLVDTIFPLAPGKFYKAKIDRESEVFGVTSFEVRCEVTGEEPVTQAGLSENALRINCKRLDSDRLFRSYLYSTKMGHFLEIQELEDTGENPVTKSLSLVSFNLIKQISN